MLEMDTFRALADPTRRAILVMLAAGERSAGEVGSAFRITGPAVSQHLKALRAGRLVRVRAEAQRRIYQLNSEGVDEVKRWLATVEPAASRAESPPVLPMRALVEARRLGLRAA